MKIALNLTTNSCERTTADTYVNLLNKAWRHIRDVLEFMANRGNTCCNVTRIFNTSITDFVNQRLGFNGQDINTIGIVGMRDANCSFDTRATYFKCYNIFLFHIWLIFQGNFHGSIVIDERSGASAASPSGSSTSSGSRCRGLRRVATTWLRYLTERVS